MSQAPSFVALVKAARVAAREPMPERRGSSEKRDKVLAEWVNRRLTAERDLGELLKKSATEIVAVLEVVGEFRRHGGIGVDSDVLAAYPLTLVERIEDALDALDAKARVIPGSVAQESHKC